MDTGSHAANRDSGTGPTVTAVAALAIVIAGFWSLDLFLARTDREAVQSQAHDLYQQGALLLQQGRASDALDPLRRANAMVRDNREYQLDYAAAMVASHKFDDADTNLKTLLETDPNNGPANLLAARLMVQESKIPEAESHYHRAIYGAWPEKAAEHRISVRLELAQLLASRAEKEELLAELLTLESEAQNDTAVLKQVARLYLTAGSPARSANAYRELIRDNRADSEAYAGLGEAELAQGDYRAALAAFLNSNRRSPGNRAVQRGIGLSNIMAALDPTPRHLTSAEKFARSTEILRRTRDALNQCTGARGGEGRNLVEQCDQILSKNTPAHVTNELAEARLTFAEQLWQVRNKTCGASTSEPEQPLRLIMSKLAHS